MNEYEEEYDADMEMDTSYYDKYDEYHKEEFVRWFYGKLKLDDNESNDDYYYYYDYCYNF